MDNTVIGKIVFKLTSASKLLHKIDLMLIMLEVQCDICLQVIDIAGNRLIQPEIDGLLKKFDGRDYDK